MPASWQVFYDAYRILGRLQTYVWINAKGFQKIMKKRVAGRGLVA